MNLSDQFDNLQATKRPNKLAMESPDYPLQIARLIFDQWEDNPNKQYYTATTRLPISILTALVEICFFASLKREEQRQVEFTLVLCPPALKEAPFRFSKFTKIFNLMRFDEPQELSISRLVRIAPACDPNNTLVLVNYDENAKRLQIWGIVDIGSPAPMGSASSIALTELLIRVTGPGEMVVTLHGRHLCTYKDGAITIAEIGLINSGPVYEFFRPTSFLFCKEVTEGLESEFHERDYRAIGYLRCLEELVERMRRQKHGGCILMIGEDKAALSNVNIKYESHDDSVWLALKGRFILHDRYYRHLEVSKESSKHEPTEVEEIASLQHQREDVEHGLTDALDTLVRLTAVDGAVIINRKFELLGFGAVVQFEQKPQYKVYHCDDRCAERKQEIRIESYGTRHRSAFDFCYVNAPSVALVVSQDGGFKMVTRIEDDVYFWDKSLFNIREV